MSRRVSLPGADELFRTTGGMALQASSPRRQANGEPRVPPPAGESDETAAKDGGSRDGAQHTDTEQDGAAPEGGNAGNDDAEDAEHGTAEPDQGAGESRRRLAERPAEDEGAEGRRARRETQDGPPGAARGAGQQGRTANPAAQEQARGRGRTAGRRPSGRERHDEKITVYVSAEELMDLEHARLVLRGEHGLAVDRGRIVREAVAVVLADLESRGDASILVRRLRGR
ncbi:hypothetical protein [Streptomyces sp. TS71-3]|uniref:hypothetical protein n=1 Tax=Streptomyces sp. TS71-3 TaxID=2733862 RepID=UPI001B2DAF9B|nr:hypothetical protein [Streptomyces sp. TS71-3]GHJ38591.1 hypothetical protein Sm713_42000 [Streptomyces sp. TS71-3]